VIGNNLVDAVSRKRRHIQRNLKPHIIPLKSAGGG